MIETEIAAPRYSLIIPAHNEETRIGRALLGYLDVFADSEVILVLNGCTDDTEAVARQAACARENLRILCIKHAVGKGGAVRAGFLAARAPVIGYVDADGATSPEEMRRLFESLLPEDDAVIASRWSKGAEVVVAQPVMRRLSSRVFNAIVRLLFGLPFHDTQCGAKVFTSAAIRRVSSTLEVSNFAFDVDVLHSLRRAGAKIREVPTRWHDIEGSRINLPRASLEMLYAISRLRLRHSLFRYVIPLFDRVWPTATLRVRHGLSVLIIDLDDPQSPGATESERYLHRIGASLVRSGHQVHWLSAGFENGARDDTIDGITIKRVGTRRLTARTAIPLTYLRHLRDRFDVIVEVQHGLPLLSPLFSLKPSVCITTQPHVWRIPFGETLRKWILRSLYDSSRFIAITSEHGRYLARLGLRESLIETSLDGTLELADAATAEDAAVRIFLQAVYAEVSRNQVSYVRSGERWAIVPRNARERISANSPKRARTSDTLL